MKFHRKNQSKCLEISIKSISDHKFQLIFYQCRKWYPLKVRLIEQQNRYKQKKKVKRGKEMNSRTLQTDKWTILLDRQHTLFSFWSQSIDRNEEQKERKKIFFFLSFICRNVFRCVERFSMIHLIQFHLSLKSKRTTTLNEKEISKRKSEIIYKKENLIVINDVLC